MQLELNLKYSINQFDQIIDTEEGRKVEPGEARDILNSFSEEKVKIKKHVLDDIGFVEVIDIMGGDARVLEAARVSTGAAATKGPEKDEKLINYLMKNEHHTPFEKIVVELHIKCPIFVARQWFRHRIGSFNEASARYKKFEWETYRPSEWRIQDTKNKQSSKDNLDDSEKVKVDYMVNQAYDIAYRAYTEMLEKGVARELARVVMPVGLYTEFFWTVNFRALMNFLKLRMDPHAQFEIQQYANTIYEAVEESEKLPWTLESFRKNVLEPFVGS